VVVWAQKFRVEESGQTEAMESWFLDLLKRSEALPWLSERASRLIRALVSAHPRKPAKPLRPRANGGAVGSIVGFVVILALLGWGALGLVGLVLWK